MPIWQIILTLRRRLREQERQIAHLGSQLAIANEHGKDGGEWGRYVNRQLQQMYHALAAGQERMTERIMATLQDLRDVLAEQNQAIIDEMAAINKAMDELKLNPSHLDDIVTTVKANTETVKGIIAEPLPEPEPVP